ncbi:MAG: sensor histidine kinase [Bosea sp. (in: a-proteobacteria)]
MALPLDPRQWSLAVKAPALVAVFMLVVSTVITNAVLSRLKVTQERHLAALSVTYLDGLASALVPHVLRDDVWEVFDTIDRSAALGGGFGKARVVVVNGRGETIAAGSSEDAALGSSQRGREDRFRADQMLVVDEEKGRAYGRRLLSYQDRPIGRIYADYDIAHLLEEREDVLRTLIASNALIALFLAAIAYLTIRAMLAPLARLSRHIDQSVAGPVQPVSLASAGASGGEFWRLFQRYNALTEALNEREALAKQLATEERLASLGLLASGMAHEINNPLGGLFNAIDTLKRHGEKAAVRDSSINLIERGLRGIRDVVRTALSTYRSDPEQRRLAVVDLDDIRLLIRPEVERKRITLTWQNELVEDLSLPGSAVRQVLLNLLLNAVAAVPESGQISVSLKIDDDALMLTVDDNGPGLGSLALDLLSGRSLRPVSTGHGTGLGLWVSRQLVIDLDGQVATGQSALGGAAISVRLPLNSHRRLSDAA